MELRGESTYYYCGGGGIEGNREETSWLGQDGTNQRETVVTQCTVEV